MSQAGARVSARKSLAIAGQTNALLTALKQCQARRSSSWAICRLSGDPGNMQAFRRAVAGVFFLGDGDEVRKLANVDRNADLGTQVLRIMSWTISSSQSKFAQRSRRPRTNEDQ